MSLPLLIFLATGNTLAIAFGVWAKSIIIVRPEEFGISSNLPLIPVNDFRAFLMSLSVIPNCWATLIAARQLERLYSPGRGEGKGNFFGVISALFLMP